MAPSNRPRTLRDLNHNSNHFTESSAAAATGALPQESSGAAGLHKIQHIPTLPHADQARTMLERVVKEFRPIAERRGYNVLSVSELCCCNDGLDFDGTKRRKLRKVSNNVLGYNRTISRGASKVHTIHLRLRHPRDHSRLFPYEDVAGTLAHELSHCEYGPHNQQFFKLMDSILEEHATLMASSSSFGGGVVVNPSAAAASVYPPNFVPFGGEGRTLGRAAFPTNTAGATTPPTLGRGYKVGGDASFTQWMTPREAAVVAALARQRQQQMRLRGNRCCRPCIVVNEDEDGDNDVQIIDVVPAAAAADTAAAAPSRRKRTPVPPSGEDTKDPPRKRQQPPEVIDLTSEETAPPVASRSPLWACGRCTFLNPTKAMSCEICLSPKA